MLNLGIDPRRLLFLRFYLRFKRDRREWKKQGGKVTKNFMVLGDYSDSAGTAKGHYFHQDLLVAEFINRHAPRRHIDIASRIDGFIAHVAAFREIEVLDVDGHGVLTFC